MLDYILVGFGLAGVSFSEQLRKEKKSFLVITKEDKSSSVVAGGMYNPVILKRFTAPWNALPQLNYAIPFYTEIEQFLNTKVLSPLPVLRIFTAIEEQNNWLIASDKPDLAPFLSTKFVKNENAVVKAKFNFGEVTQTGRLQVAKLLKAYKAYLQSIDSYKNETFNYADLELTDTHVSYKGITAKQIVFMEGFGMKSNPFFKYLPLNGTKGEVLIIEAPALQAKAILKASAFIIPLETANHYLVGATYNWADKSWQTTTEARETLETKLTEIIDCPYKVIDQYAGIRPTVTDRRPLVGQHPLHKNMYVLNGLGTRGVLVAPMVSEVLYNHVENNIALSSDINITRFASDYNNPLSNI